MSCCRERYYNAERQQCRGPTGDASRLIGMIRHLADRQPCQQAVGTGVLGKPDNGAFSGLRGSIHYAEGEDADRGKAGHVFGGAVPAGDAENDGAAGSAKDSKSNRFRPAQACGPMPRSHGDGIMSALKIKEFPGLQRIAPETIEKHGMEQALRDAQYARDVQLHDLRSEFPSREGKLRQEYLDRVAEIAAA